MSNVLAYRRNGSRYVSSHVPRLAVLAGRSRFDSEHAQAVIRARSWHERKPAPSRDDDLAESAGLLFGAIATGCVFVVGVAMYLALLWVVS